MSNIYIQEPPTHGKVLLVTTVGDIDIELWSKEAPKACRNFIQLCMEGYYNGTIFHRVVKNFIVQGGDPTGTGRGGESVYGQPFKDEFHSRLRFVRRGLVAMANAGANDNGSQFFFTLAATPELNNKHTIFGKVAGNTVYNMLKLVDCEIGPDDRPTYPCKINRTEVLSSPFDDIIPREIRRAKENGKDEKKSKSKSKATKNFSLLSFGEEAEEDEEEVDKATKNIRGKSKSSHDLADDPQLSTVPVVENIAKHEGVKRSISRSNSEDNIEKAEEKAQKVSDVRKKLKKTQEKKDVKLPEKEEEKAQRDSDVRKKLKKTQEKKDVKLPEKEEEKAQRDSDVSKKLKKTQEKKDVKLPEKEEEKAQRDSDVRKKLKKTQEKKDVKLPEKEEEKAQRDSDVRKKPKKTQEKKDVKLPDKDVIVKEEEPKEATPISRSEQLRMEANKLKKEIKGSRKKEDPACKESVKKPDKPKGLPENDAIAAYRQERQKYKDLRKSQKKKGGAREDVTLTLLKKFQTKLDSAKTVASGYSDEESESKEVDDDEDMSWMSHKLKFDEKTNKVLDANITDVDRYEIFDPRNPMTKRRREASKKSSKNKR